MNETREICAIKPVHHWLLLAAILGVTTCEASANPQFAAADPHATYIGDRFLVYPTIGGTDFVVFSSTDLRHWESSDPILSFADVAWINDDKAPRHYAWAPCIASRDGKFFLYYSVGPQKPTPSRIGVAVCDRLDGRFVDIGHPLITGGDGFEAIDPMVFIDTDGAAYLYAGGSAGKTLRVWELGADMVSLAREFPVDTPEHFCEGAFMHRRGDVYYLSYSSGSWRRSSYSVHYATAPSPTGPWTYQSCILSSDDHHKGPGHHSFVQDPESGVWYIFYHRWETTEEPGPYRGSRQVAVERVTYDEQGLINPITMTDGDASPHR